MKKNNYYKDFLRPLLFKLEPETAHQGLYQLAKVLSLKPKGWASKENKLPSLKTKVFDIDFESPIGLAAGFDKSASLIPLTEALGFAFAELGSLTNHPSSGNQKPRIFRLKKDEALINRLGLNNPGPEEFLKKLSKKTYNIPLAINIAKTHDPNILGEKGIEDICECYKKASSHSNFHVLNISCPNTKEGKTFEDVTSLKELLSEVNLLRNKEKPLLVKFSADLSKNALDELLQVTEDADISGYVFSNTSTKRESLITSKESLNKIGPGGLSGVPLYERSLSLLKHANKNLKGSKILIGVGGVDSGAKALAFLKAGASLVEIYTALIYQGPFLVQNIKEEIDREIKKEGATSLSELLS